MKTKLPTIDYKGEDARAIALLAARLCLLPDKKTVGQFKKAVFPTQRKTALRATPIIDESVGRTTFQAVIQQFNDGVSLTFGMTATNWIATRVWRTCFWCLQLMQV